MARSQLRAWGASSLVTTAMMMVQLMVGVRAVVPGGFEEAGNSLVGAMMLFLGDERSVYILDKAEGNRAQVNGHSAWGAVWDIASQRTVVQDVPSNSFCASGMHLPNGSWANFGGNDAVTIGGKVGSQLNADGTGSWDSALGDFDGRRAVRVVNPCSVNDNLDAGNCKWTDRYTDGLQRRRWYSSAEATGEGAVVIIGGMTAGGYINRETPVRDPVFQRGQSEPTYEYFPARAAEPQVFQFLVDAGGLNTYAHTFLMPDGRFFLQANLSTVLWDHETNTETQLPQMPKGVVRVYPASGATAMLPLTPANDYTPTILFCGGQDMPTDNYGGYGSPAVAVWDIRASRDCQRITPQPKDGSAPQYVQDEDMPEGRTMGQFIALPDGKYLVINGAYNGTAGYTTGGVPGVPFAQMPAGPALASGPVFTPALYDPQQPLGQRWSNAGLSPSPIARMYHSTALLLPDASVLVAGSNTHPDVNLDHIYPTEYRLERFFPPYFSAPIRPAPQGVPKTLSYGGDYFNITLPAGGYPSSDAKELGPVADTIKVVVVRGGFTTHAMNMGQRYLELRTSYTVNSDRSIVLHVSQMPPNSNLFQPGPALLFVNVGGIPSNGTHLIVGNGQLGPQPTSAIATLPEKSVAQSILPPGQIGGGTGGTGQTGDSSSTGAKSKSVSTGMIVGVALAGAAVLAVLAAVVLLWRRRMVGKKVDGEVAGSGVGAAGPLTMREATGSQSALQPPGVPWTGAKSDGSESDAESSIYGQTR